MSPPSSAGAPPQTSIVGWNVALLAGVLLAALVLLSGEGGLGLVPLTTWALFGPIALVGLGYAGFELSLRRFVPTLGLGVGAGYLLPFVMTGALGSHAGALFYGAATVFAHGATTRLLAPSLRVRLRTAERAPNPLLVLVPIGVAVCGLVRGDPSVELVGLTVFLAVSGLYLMLFVDPGTLLAVLLAGLFVGVPGHLFGVFGGLSAMLRPGPFALESVGLYPLTFLLIYGVSGLLARESLVARTRYFQEPRLYEPAKSHPMWTGDGPSKVVSLKGEDRFALLDDALEQAGFWLEIEKVREASGKAAAELRVAIKPNLMFMYSEHDRSTFTDPALVEHLVDRLRDRGYRAITVVEAQSAYGNYFHDREVPNVARVAGYDPKGRYEIVDLTAEQVPVVYPGHLGDHFIGPTWRDADFRVSFAKNKTHTWAFYTLTLKNVYGALPAQDKLKEYHDKREIYYPTIDSLLAYPVHFGLVDAWESADGPFGIFADKDPLPTRTVLAGKNLVAVDWVGASKMGLDPLVSRFMQLAVQAFGKPDVELVGDASVYANFRNVPRELVDFWDHAEESYSFTNTLFSIINREYVSKAFRRKPLAWFASLLASLLYPLGGLVYKAPPKEPPP